MNNTPRYNLARIAGLSLVFAMLAPVAVAQQGHVLNGVGPIDQGMSGAGMAAPQDAMTALHWNPASVFAVPGQSLDISLQLMMPSGTMAATVPTPAGIQSGSTDSEAGPFPIPSIAYSRVIEGSKLAYGLSAFGVGGFGVDYVGSTQPGDNPLLFPQLAGGFGEMNSTFMLLQISPSIAYQVSDGVYVGIAPTLNMASLELSVMPATAPSMLGYPDAPATWAMGFGVQGGVHATMDQFNIGLSVKSPQFFQDFEYTPENGAADYTFRMDVPMIISGAIAYTGMEGLVVSADVRYLDYGNTEGFKESGFDPATFAVRGFGWKSIMSFAVGAQYEVMPGLPVRVGYAFNENPIADDMTFYNTPAPAIIQQHVSAGFSYTVSEKFVVSLAGQLGLENDISGGVYNPQFAGGATPVPGSAVTSTLSTLTVIGGVSVTL